MNKAPQEREAKKPPYRLAAWHAHARYAKVIKEAADGRLTVEQAAIQIGELNAQSGLEMATSLDNIRSQVVMAQAEGAVSGLAGEDDGESSGEEESSEYSSY
jgi:hypothetical protein